MVIADFRSYINTQRRVAEAYRDQERWARMAILNTAASGRFSIDRTIKEYNTNIWRLKRVPAYPVGNLLSLADKVNQGNII
jgi:starch phosphorylase